MTHKGWDILDEMPHGWKEDKTVGSPLHDCIFITNGKSVLNGQKRALLKSVNKEIQYESNPEIVKTENVVKEIDKNYIFPARAVNELARKRFQEQILKEIMFDFMVCEIEGWSKLEYIVELKALINGIKAKILTHSV